MTQNLETLQNERENLARQLKELDRQIKFVKEQVPKYDINHPDSPIHTLVDHATKLGLHLKIRQTAKGTIKLEITGNHESVNTKQNFITFVYQTPEPIMTNEQIENLCYQFAKQIDYFKIIDNIFFSMSRSPEIIKLTSLNQKTDFACNVTYGKRTIQTTFHLTEKFNVSSNAHITGITLNKELVRNRMTRDRETLIPIDQQDFMFRISLSQKGQTQNMMFQNIGLTKTIKSSESEPLTRNMFCHELKLFVRKYNVLTNNSTEY